MEDGKLYTNADVQVENKRETLVSSEDEGLNLGGGLTPYTF